MTEPAIQVEHLSKEYRIGARRERYLTLRDRLAQTASGIFRRDASQRESTLLKALDDVSFNIEQGQVVGIIGRNGAGKSTLLKILSRITEPTRGRAIIRGRVGSLLEVGTGFHPELTGRENIYLNGAVLGMRKAEIDRKFDEIVAFAEVEKFIETPVKRYSSGMYVRLAFAVAAHLETEILLVDEVLAVGDAEFQKKSLGKMGDVAKGGRTVLFVSHNMGAVQSLCSRCLFLSSGKMAGYGDTHDIIARYISTDISASEWNCPEANSPIANPYFNPTRMYLVDTKSQPITREIGANEEVGIVIEGWVARPNIALTVGFALLTADGSLLFWSLHTDVAQDHWPSIVQGPNRLISWLPKHLLNEGSYRIELILSLHYQEWLSEPGNNAPSISLSVRGALSDSPYWMAARPGLLAPILPFQVLQD